MNYDNEFRQEALKLSDEIGVKKHQNSWESHTTHSQHGEARESSMENMRMLVAVRAVNSPIPKSNAYMNWRRKSKSFKKPTIY